MEKILRRSQKCSYCRQELTGQEWGSEWGTSDLQHYKSHNCQNCGRKNWHRVKFEGSGHDSFLVQGEVSLESKLKRQWCQY